MARPFPEQMEILVLGMGCFWGVEKIFWNVPGVYVTSVGYSAGYTPNPTYKEVCTGLTGHNEVVQVVYDPGKVSCVDILKIFWENHDPTQGMRQGNDIGTQYRSGIYFTLPEQHKNAQATLQYYQQNLTAAGFGTITTEIKPATEFYYAEEYHQQYLAKNPNGYCGIGGTGVSFSTEKSINDPRVEELLSFWFSEPVQKMWFNSTVAFDNTLRDKYEPLYQEAVNNQLDLIILFDQLPLNIYRNQKESFQTDARAREVAEAVIARGDDARLSDGAKLFLYLPYMHSENMADQDKSVALFEKAGMMANARYARHHRKIIERFGRFPHRNEPLGRASTQAELDYLASDEAFLG